MFYGRKVIRLALKMIKPLIYFKNQAGYHFDLTPIIRVAAPLMKASKDKANPDLVNEVLKAKLAG